MEAAITEIRQSLQRERPVFAPFRYSHGIDVIVGLDEPEVRGQETLLLRIAGEQTAGSQGLAAVPAAESWSGPVPGPTIWADNPLFVLEKAVEPLAARVLVRQAFRRAVAQFSGAPLPYAAHPAAQKYARPSLAGRSALQGEPAWQASCEEVARKELADFSLIWRIDAQVEQLAFGRSNAAAFLRSLVRSDLDLANAHEIAERYASTAALARELCRAYWDKRWRQEQDPERVWEGIWGSASFVYDISGLSKENSVHIGRQVAVMDTPWGVAAVLESPARRRHNVRLAKGILANERRCISALRLQAP